MCPIRQRLGAAGSDPTAPRRLGRTEPLPCDCPPVRVAVAGDRPVDRVVAIEPPPWRLKPGGWILLNSPQPPHEFAHEFAPYRIATVDATTIARDNDLGTRSVPIVNTALAGAAARLLGLNLESVIEAFGDFGFGG